MADVAVAGEGYDAARRRRLPGADALVAALAAEGERRVLWLPVFFGAGIALYFALTVEPPPWLGGVTTIAAVAAGIVLRRWPAWRGAAIAVGLAAAGFALIQASVWQNGAPMLPRQLSSAALTGRVIDVDVLDRGWRVVIAPDAIAGLEPEAQPRRLRIHIAPTSDLFRPGDGIALKARLYPVPAQIVPGGRDMQRELFFVGIGGVGYSYGAAHLTTRERLDGIGERWREWLLQLRTEMTRRINAVLPGSTGGVASAVITGKRGAMEERVKEAFRESGLSHLLAIAGLHLGLVGGFVFFAVRGALALIAPLALRYPIKSKTA